MFDFGFGTKKILGIDIGASALKIVELELRSGKAYLSNYAWMEIPDISEKNNNIGSSFFETATPEYIKKALKLAKIKTKKTYASIPSFGGLITLIDFPEMAPEDMEQAIKFEAHKYIPTSLDEVVTSWEVIKDEKTNNKQKNNIQVLLVAASKNKVLTYEKIIKDADLKPLGIEMENLAMVDSLVGNDLGNFIIIDIGWRVCNIIYTEKGIIKANRNIDAGGKDITKIIARSLGITFERAEKMKISEKDFFSAESSLHFPSVDIIAGEITRIINVLPKRGDIPDVDALILSGGTANLFGFREFIQKKIGVKTIIGNPFSRIGYDKKIEPALEKIKSQFSVAIGLALKGIENLREK
ncbi:MAG: type IV pilus assembly protein PilM [Parcubacteria group bacterium]|jgi:type IV pilus assembly protein PilM